MMGHESVPNRIDQGIEAEFEIPVIPKDIELPDYNVSRWKKGDYHGDSI